MVAYTGKKSNFLHAILRPCLTGHPVDKRTTQRNILCVFFIKKILFQKKPNKSSKVIEAKKEDEELPKVE